MNSSAKLRISEGKTKLLFEFFPNRWSSESHHACMFGRVVTEENKVNVSNFGEAKVTIKREQREPTTSASPLKLLNRNPHPFTPIFGPVIQGW